MSHYNLWLDKYATRRSQVVKKFSEYRKLMDEIKSKIPHKELFLEIIAEGEIPKSKMCFVDGGEGLTELMGLGVYFIRASGLLWSENPGYSKGECFERQLDMNIIDYDDYTKERVELLRDCMEYDVALECVKKHKPEYLFLDGSLYVKARRKPVECEEYGVYIKKYVRLLKECKKEKIHLIGVSEDSKSKLFGNYLTQKYGVKFPPFMTDATILKILTGNKICRTIEFTPHSKLAANDEITTTLTARFPTAYLQPTELANPMRIDVPEWEPSFDRILEIITMLSRGSKYYGYPIPLYLAHLDARIKEDHMEWSTDQMTNYIMKTDPVFGSAIFRKTRRGRRPA
jgi:hypothetical protein